MNLARISSANYNPIDLVENIFSRKPFDVERRNINEIAIEIQGKWNNMLLFFSFEPTIRCLHMSCLMDIETDIEDRSKIFELLALANEDLWMGHFSYWTEQKMPVFKHSFILNNQESINEEKISQLIDIAIKECEKMYPVFNVVLTKGMDPKQAMYPMLMETMGQA